MNYREPTMLGERAKSSYQELVRYYKYINKTTRVEDFLIEVFDNALRDLKTNYQVSVCRNSKSGIQLTQQQSKCIDLLNKKFEINSWDEHAKTHTKIPHDILVDIIKDSFNVRGRDAISGHKKAILKILDLKLIRSGNNWYVVHKKFLLDPGQQTLAVKRPPIVDKLIDRIKSSEDGLLKIHVTQQCGSEKMYKIFKNFAFQEGINYDKSEDRFLHKEIKKVDPKEEADAIFSNLGYGGAESD